METNPDYSPENEEITSNSNASVCDFYGSFVGSY